MSLLDELRSILSRHKDHVLAQTNQGTVHLIEAHLAQLDHAADDAEAHKVLGALYQAMNAPAPETPAAAPSGETVIVGEHGPEFDFPHAPDAEPAAAEPEPEDEQHPDGAV